MTVTVTTVADEAGGLGRESAVDDLAVLDPDDGLEALIGSVEVRRGMLVMIHSDDDAEEEGDDGAQQGGTQNPQTGTSAPGRVWNCVAPNCPDVTD